jgi:predicted metalloprotease with PDZ domain
MLRNHRGHFHLLLVGLVFATFGAAQAQPTAQAVVQHFYQAADGVAWQQYEECDSEGTAAVAGKTGSLRYVEDLRSGANVSQEEIQALDPGRPGAQAGIQPGDVISAIDGKTPSDEMNQPAFLQPPGTQLQLTVQRGTETRQVTVTIKDVL